MGWGSIHHIVPRPEERGYLPLRGKSAGAAWFGAVEGEYFFAMVEFELLYFR